MFIKSKSSRKGIILISTLILLLILFILGFAFLTIVSSDYFQAGGVRSDIQAYYLAQSGLNYLQAELKNKSHRTSEYLGNLAREERPMTTGTFKITIVDSQARPVKITSTGKVGKKTKTIEAEVDLSSGAVIEGHILQ